MSIGVPNREDLGDVAGLVVGALVLVLAALGDPATVFVGAAFGLFAGMLLMRSGAFRGGVLAAALGAVVAGLLMASFLFE